MPEVEGSWKMSSKHDSVGERTIGLGVPCPREVLAINGPSCRLRNRMNLIPGADMAS